jgi:uncharacterized membrane protein
MSTLTPSTRFDRLDALRGLAMVWMTAYHFAFDLNHFKFIAQNFYTDPVWTWQRTCIVSLFLLCAGAGQAVAVHQGQNWQRFGRRWAQVALAALLVSAGSYAMFPNSWIYFGVLHGIAVMLIVVRLTAGWGAWLWVAGAVAIAIKFVAVYAINSVAAGDFLQIFNTKPLNWLGFVSKKPITEDYVPLIPWLGVMWWGMAAGQWLLRRRPEMLSGGVGAAKPLAALGNWSLSYYLVHQPVLIGLLTAVAALTRA